MKYLSQAGSCLSHALERLGLYEPEINVQEARDRLSLEAEIWRRFQRDRNGFWNDSQADHLVIGQLPSLVEKAVTHLVSRGIERGIAVDLGCGISPTAFNLLERGWKVYAVDSSDAVIKTLEQKSSLIGKNWIENKQLVFINTAIEEFKYPEKVHLVVAMNSLPYCDPEKIGRLFFRAKNALFAEGVLACNLFAYNENPAADPVIRQMFGAWMTTKNIVEAVIRLVRFSECRVTKERSPGGMAEQFHILANR